MKRIVILGCENSHANNFLKILKDGDKYSDYEVMGVWSEYASAAEKLGDEFGVPVMENYDGAVGKVDGVIITARRGDVHYKYAKPYIKSGVPMFIDKPITCDCGEAVEFMRELSSHGVKVTGGSSLRNADEIIKLRDEVISGTNGRTVGGVVRAPIQSDSIYCGYWFYAQHLVEMLCTVYGRYPKSVKAFSVGVQKTAVFRYEGYDIIGVWGEHVYKYYAVRFSENGSTGGEVPVSENWFAREFEDFDRLMNGEAQKQSYGDFIAPVFILDAVKRSLESGEEIKTEYAPL